MNVKNYAAHNNIMIKHIKEETTIYKQILFLGAFKSKMQR